MGIAERPGGTKLMTVVSARTTRRPYTRARVSSLLRLSLSSAAIDLVLLLIAAELAIVGREHLRFLDPVSAIRSTLGVIGPVTVLGWLAAIYLNRGYRVEVYGAGTDEYKRVAQAGIYTAALLGIGCYLTDFPLSRGFFVLLFGVGLPLVLVGRLTLRRAVHAARRRGGLSQRVLISGSQAQVDEIAGVLGRESWLGYRVMGALTPAVDHDEETPGGVPVLGDIDDVGLVSSSDVDVVFFAGGAHTTASDMRRTMWKLENEPVKLVVAPSVSDISSGRTRLRPVGGLPLVHIDPPTWTDASRLGKRTFDMVGSLTLLVLVAPSLLMAAAWIKLHDGGPVIFRQSRVRRDGEVFECLKLRSMVVDAEERLTELHAQTDFSRGLFKLRLDPRITKPGRWLRRLSIDELPQLVNVLRGEMSLVGPRPPLPTEASTYSDEVARRLHVRPGMTGLWQVSGRSDLSWEETIRLDLYYVDNWSMLQDLAILVRTFGAVARSRGAY